MTFLFFSLGIGYPCNSVRTLGVDSLADRKRQV